MSRSDTTHTWRCFWTSKQKLLHEIQVVLITASSVSGSLWFICLLVSFPRGKHTEWVQKRSVWTWSPTAAEMKGTAWRNISRPSSSRHRKPFFKTSDPTAKSNAFTRPPLWHICQEKIHVCVEREKKKNQVLLGKAGVVLSTSVKAPSITLLPLRATDALKTQEL